MTPIEHALHYAARGWYVLPIRPGEKSPLTRHGLKDATTDAAVIREWWERWPNANVGIRTGPESGIWVLGPDGEQGLADLSKLEDQHGALPRTAKVQSGSGGQHWYFRWPAEGTVVNRRNHRGTKIDVRGAGGYVVAPPSTIATGAYIWLDDVEPVDALSWLLDWSRGSGQVKPSFHLPDAALDRARAYVAACPPAIAEQGGHNQTFAVARTLVLGFALPQETALSVLLAEYNPRCVPPWSEKELRHKVADADAKPFDKPRGYLIGETVHQHQPVVLAASFTQPKIANRPRCVPDVICLADVEPQVVPWLWRGRIPLGRITLLVGRPGAGKSFLTCDLAARLSRGMHWPEPGFDTAPLGDTLLICAEDDPADTIVPRLIEAGADRSRTHMLKAAKLIEVDGKEKSVAFDLSNVDLIRDTLIHLPECKLVVIDPIGSYLGGGVDAHRDNEVRSVLAPLAAIASERSVAVLLVCHTRKATATFADDTALGSRAFVGLARSVLHLVEDEEDKKRKLLLPGKCNLSVSPPGLAFRVTGDPGRLEWEPDPLEGFHADDAMAANVSKEASRGPAPTSRDAATDWLVELLKNGTMAVEEIKKQAKQAELGWRTIRRAQAELKIVPRKRSFAGGWEWSLPASEGGQPDAEVGQVPRRCPSIAKLGQLRENTSENSTNCLESCEGVQVTENLATFDADANNVATFDNEGGLFPNPHGLPD